MDEWTSSTSAIRPTANVIPYAAAKAAVNAMTEGFARAFGPTVRVNCIMPGPFLTDISKAWDLDTFRERARTTMALGRGGLPEEVVGAALYFASGASSGTTRPFARNSSAGRPLDSIVSVAPAPPRRWPEVQNPH